MEKSVAVVIVNWNGGRLLQQCLAHLDRQTLKPNYIFLMDNKSSDGSAQIAKTYTAVMLHELGENYGFAVANNKAISDCKAELIALLNPDALADSQWLEKLVNAANEMPEFSVFGSRQMQLYTKENIDGLGDTYHISGLAWRKGYGKKINDLILVDGPIFSACACAALYQTSALKEVGLFDEDFFCYFEDVDLGFRFNLAGYKAIMVVSAVVYHAGSASTGGSSSDFSIYYGHRNLVWTYFKNMPGVLFWLFLPIHLGLN